MLTLGAEETDKIKQISGGPLVKPFISNEIVVIPLIYGATNGNPHAQSDELPVNPKHLLFLHAYVYDQLSLEDAASQAGISDASAKRFLKSNEFKTLEYNHAQIQTCSKTAVKEHVLAEWNKVYTAEKPPHHRVEMIRDMLDRVVPRVYKNENINASTTITFNFSVESVKGALDRQKALEAEVAQELDAAA